MKKNYNAPGIRIRKFNAPVLLDASTNAASVEQQAKANYANVQMTKVNIQWSEKN